MFGNKTNSFKITFTSWMIITISQQAMIYYPTTHVAFTNLTTDKGVVEM